MLALVACIAWLLGVEGLPALHQAHHDDHHTHDASGAVIDHGDHAHAPVADHDERDLNQLAVDHPVAPRHESGGLAHHAVALHAVTPPAIVPVIALESRVEPTHVAIEFPDRGTQPSARGPPSSA